MSHRRALDLDPRACILLLYDHFIVQEGSMGRDKQRKPGKTKSPERIKKTTNDGGLSEAELSKVSGGKTGNTIGGKNA